MNLYRLKPWLSAGVITLGGSIGLAHADVSITPSLTDAATTVRAGSVMKYDAKFQNSGDTPVTPSDGYTLQVKIPDGVTLYSKSTCEISEGCGQVTVNGSLLRMALSKTLNPGESAGFSFELMLPSSLSEGAQLTTEAEVLRPTDNSSMNLVQDTNTVRRPEITNRIGQLLPNGTLFQKFGLGDTVTYTVTTRSTSSEGSLPMDVPYGKVTGTVPSDLTNVSWSCEHLFVPGQRQGGCIPQSGTGNAIELEVGGMDRNESVVITVTGTLDPNATVGKKITNTATISPISGSPLSYSKDSTESAYTTITVTDLSKVHYSFTKQSSEDLAGHGPKMPYNINRNHYTITLTNEGKIPYVGVLKDTVQDDLKLTHFYCYVGPTSDCGAGPGKSIFKQEVATQSIAQAINVPAGEQITLNLWATPIGDIGTVVTNTAHLETDPTLPVAEGMPTTATVWRDSVIVGPVNIEVKFELQSADGPPPGDYLTGIGSKPSFVGTFTNIGEIDATDVSLNIGPYYFDRGLIYWETTFDWTCTATGSAVCPAPSGTGTQEHLLGKNLSGADIPVGGALAFTLIPHDPIPEKVVPAGNAFGEIYPTLSIASKNPNLSFELKRKIYAVKVIAYNAKVTKSSKVSSVVAGAPLEYLIEVENLNPINQDNLRVSDPLTDRMIEAEWSCAECNPANGTGDIDTLATIPANGTISISLKGKAAPTLLPRTELINEVYLLNSEGGVVQSARKNIDVTGSVDVGVVKTANLSYYNVGVSTPVVYTVEVSNNGISTAMGTPISVIAPAGVTYGSWSCEKCSVTSGTGNINTTANIAQNEPVTITINATVGSEATGTLTSTATVANPSGYEQVPNSNQTKTASVSLKPLLPELTLTSKASAESFIVGVPASYTVTVTNSGGADTKLPATVSAVIPAGLTVGTPPANCSVAGQVITCTVPGGLATKVDYPFTFPVTPTRDAADKVTLSATVRGEDDASCPAEMHCIATVDTPVLRIALEVSKEASSSTFTVGAPANYTISVTNKGTTASTTAGLITDDVPSGLNLGTLPAACTAVGQSVSCTVAAGLAANETLRFEIPVTPTARAKELKNTAKLVGGDPSCTQELPCNSQTVTVDVHGVHISAQIVASSPSMPAGTPASYTLSAINNGELETSDVTVVSNTFNNLFTIDTSKLPQNCSVTGQTVTCTIEKGLQPAQNNDFIIHVTPTAPAIAVPHTVKVTGGGDVNCTENTPCTADNVIDIVNGAQLNIEKTIAQTALRVNVPVDYSIRVSNTGTGPTASELTVTDEVPAGLRVDAISDTCTVTDQSVVCTIAAGLAVGEAKTLSITVTPMPELALGEVSNTATLTATDPLDCQNGCSSIAQATLMPTPPEAAIPVPTLSHWMLALLGALMLVIGLLWTGGRRHQT